MDPDRVPGRRALAAGVADVGTWTSEGAALPTIARHRGEQRVRGQVCAVTDDDHAVTTTINDPPHIVIHRDVTIVKQRAH